MGYSCYSHYTTQNMLSRLTNGDLNGILRALSAFFYAHMPSVIFKEGGRDVGKVCYRHNEKKGLLSLYVDRQVNAIEIDTRETGLNIFTRNFDLLVDIYYFIIYGITAALFPEKFTYINDGLYSVELKNLSNTVSKFVALWKKGCEKKRRRSEDDFDDSQPPLKKKPNSDKHISTVPPTVLTPRCCTCCKYPHFPDNEECFHCLKMTYDDDKCRTINETGSNVGRQCGYKPIEDNQRCLKHNEEFIDVVRSSDEEESSGNEDDDDSIVVTDHSSDGECVSSDECETTVE